MPTPTHKTTAYIPGKGTVLVHEAIPTGKASGEFHCKYCYSDHREWWQMDVAEYGCDVLLCGRCEHTTKREFLG